MRRSSNTGSVGDYVVTAKIGSGSFAVVYKGHHRSTHLPVAIKAINRERLNKKLQENLESEIAIMRNMNHPNIVRLFEIKKTEKHIYLIMEYCAGGDLQKFIKKNKIVSEDVAQRFLKQLAQGLAVLWAHNLIHRDLKPQNLLLTECSGTADLKIADFGFARHLATAAMAETLCGSPLYMAPEILKFQKYDAKADLWSVGAILFEMITGRPPFSGANHVQLLANIERHEVKFPEGVVLKKDCILLVQNLLRRNPLTRMSFEDFFSSAYVDIDPREAAGLATSSELPAEILDQRKSQASSVIGNSSQQHSVAISTNEPPKSAPIPRTNPFKQNRSDSPYNHATKPPLSRGSTFTLGHDEKSSSSRLVIEGGGLDTSGEYVIVDGSTQALLSKYGRLLGQPLSSQAIAALNSRNESPSQLSYDASSILQYVEAIGCRAQAIARLGDRLIAPVSSATKEWDLDDAVQGQTSKPRLIIGQAFTLYIRSLHIFHHAISVIEPLLETPQSNKNSESLVPARRSIIWLTDQLGKCVGRARQCRQRLPDGFFLVNCGDELLYTHALSIGREAALKEVLGQRMHGSTLFDQARLLLEALLMTKVAVAMRNSDRNIVLKFIECFKTRADVLSLSK